MSGVMADMLDRRVISAAQMTHVDPARQYDLSVNSAGDANELITEAARRLAAAAPGSQVILFGSHARGEAGPRSDFDFLVIEPDVSDEAAESVRLRRALRGLRLPTDIIVVSRRYADRCCDVKGGLVNVALSEGRTLIRR